MIKYITGFLVLAGIAMNSIHAQARPVAGQEWEHYSGKRYRIVAIGRLTESDTLEECVVYESLYTDPTFGEHPIWIRPLSMFMEEGVFNGKQQPRFALRTSS